MSLILYNCFIENIIDTKKKIELKGSKIGITIED